VKGNYMNSSEYDGEYLRYTQRILSNHLGEIVDTPTGKMRLTELYSNGNVACIPIKCKNYHKELKEFHSVSVKPVS